MKNRVVVIGVGNILLRDEGVGVHVVKELAKTSLPSGYQSTNAGLWVYIS